ncbi:MAG: RpiB/LacA/LacB family sugar-phosphate isomerase [Mycoplasma sp.]
MKIAIGCDHIATKQKDELKDILVSWGHKVIDCGTYDDTRTHYTIYGFEVARQVGLKKANLGVVLCGTGVGITNSANKTYGARCCLTRDVACAVAARKYYNANIIGVGARISGMGLITEIVKAFLNAKYDGSHKADIKKIDSVLRKPNYNTKQFDLLIKKWESGKYTGNKKEKKVPLPKTFSKKK